MKSKNQKGIFKVSPGASIENSTLSEVAPAFIAALGKASEGSVVEVDLLETMDPDSGTIKFLLAAASECQQRGLKFAVRASGKTGELLQIVNMARHMGLNIEDPSK
jgi:hypothetical protein